MKRHTRIYLTYFGFTVADFIPCEVCDDRAVDIHHIVARGMGGDPQGKKDVIENLMALCRTCHDQYGDITHYRDFLIEKHLQKLKT